MIVLSGYRTEINFDKRVAFSMRPFLCFHSVESGKGGSSIITIKRAGFLSMGTDPLLIRFCGPALFILAFHNRRVIICLSASSGRSAVLPVSEVSRFTFLIFPEEHAPAGRSYDNYYSRKSYHAVFPVFQSPHVCLPFISFWFEYFPAVYTYCP